MYRDFNQVWPTQWAIAGLALIPQNGIARNGINHIAKRSKFGVIFGSNQIAGLGGIAWKAAWEVEKVLNFPLLGSPPKPSVGVEPTSSALRTLLTPR
ncbi:MAG: hypothetical protein FWG79_09430 [Bacteroidales bacterium]|nr:hypothetical protein [Bacteroidales bacterium]